MTNRKKGHSNWGVRFQTDAMYNFEIMSSSRILNGRNPDFYIPNQVFWMRWLSGACRRALVHRGGLMGSSFVARCPKYGLGFSHFVEAIFVYWRGWSYIYFVRDSFPRCSCSNILRYLGTCKKSCCHFVETFSQDFWDDRESSYYFF